MMQPGAGIQPLGAARGGTGLGVAMIVVSLLALYFAVGPLARSPYAEVILPGPIWFRRIAVGRDRRFHARGRGVDLVYR
jgi:hypothetical protein